MVKSFFRNLFRLSDQPQDRTFKIIHSKAIGSTGTESYSGYVSEEYLETLRGSERAKIYDKMRRSDAQIKMCLSAVKNPIKAATWEVEPWDQNDEDAKADAELVKWVLFEGMRKTWTQFVHEALSVIDHGHSVFEQIDRVAFDHPKFGTINCLTDLAFRSQKTIERFNLNRETDQLSSITQYAYGDLDRKVDIPAEFLVVFSLDKEGSNYEGISALRSVYGNYFRKNEYLKMNAIGIEKFAIPTPVVEVPEGKEAGPQFNYLIEALESYMVHEKNYLTTPAGWKIDLKTSTYDPEKVEGSIDAEDKRIVKSFLANFLELGINGFGSQSLSFDLSDFFLSALDHIALLIAEEINASVIPRIIQMNRGDRQGYPKLKHSGISDRAGVELATMLSQFSQGRIVTPDDVLEGHIRKRFGLPEKSDKGIRQVGPAPAGPAVPLLSEKLAGIRARRG